LCQNRAAGTWHKPSMALDSGFPARMTNFLALVEESC